MNTAGRAVIFAGTTVVIALMGMFALGVNFLYGLALSSSIAVLLVLAASLTLLPALLTFFGRRIGKPGVLARRRTGPQQDRSSFWTRWISVIQRRPWVAFTASGALMLVLASPVLGLRLGNTDAGNDPKSQTTRKAYDLLAQGFGKGFSGPLLVAVKLPRPGRHLRARPAHLRPPQHPRRRRRREATPEPEQGRRDDLRLPRDLTTEHPDRGTRQSTCAAA